MGCLLRNLSDSARFLAQKQRVGHAGRDKAFRAQDTAVAASARESRRRRIVAAVREAVVQPERDAATDDLGLRQLDERRVDAEARAFDAGARRDARPAPRTPGRTRAGSPDSRSSRAR